MTLESMFYLSQTIAAFAIVSSLLFVALEVRGSNQVSRHRIVEELLADYRAVRMGISNHPDVTRAWLTGLHDFTALDPLDKIRFSLNADLFFQTTQSLYLHYRDGRISREMFEPQQSMLVEFLGYPGLRAVWEIRKKWFHTAYRTIVDDAIATTREMPNLYRETQAQSG
jgi:hypothetical protein